MKLTLAIVLIWVLYSIIEGIREAYYYNLYYNASGIKNVNLHPLYTLQRGLVLLLISIFCVYWNVVVLKWDFILIIQKGLVLLGGLASLFPFFHDGFYYIMRNKLNPSIYPYKFFDHSTTSTAKFEFTFFIRVVLFIVGFFLILNYVL